MPDKNKENLGLATVFLLMLRCVRCLPYGINALTRLVLPENMGARLAYNRNAAIFDDFWQSRTPTYRSCFKRELDEKGINIGVLAGLVLLLSGIEKNRWIIQPPVSFLFIELFCFLYR